MEDPRARPWRLTKVSGTVKLGYDLRSDYWNQGLATEAATAVRDYAFETLRLPRLVSLIRQGNIASRRVAEKIGMRHLEDSDRSGHPYWLFGQDRPEPAGEDRAAPSHLAAT